MKRSEMVQTIAISLMSRLSEWEKEERLKFADEILQDIEIEGMLPPVKDDQYKAFQKVREGYGYALVSVNRFQWEEEDEEK